MSTRKLSVLVACLVLAVVVCVRWYLQVEAPVYAGQPELYELESGRPEARCVEEVGPYWRELSCLDDDLRADAGA